jgi:hypothetical protein
LHSSPCPCGAPEPPPPPPAPPRPPPPWAPRGAPSSRVLPAAQLPERRCAAAPAPPSLVPAHSRRVPLPLTKRPSRRGDLCGELRRPTILRGTSVGIHHLRASVGLTSAQRLRAEEALPLVDGLRRRLDSLASSSDFSLYDVLYVPSRLVGLSFLPQRNACVEAESGRRVAAGRLCVRCV